MSFMFTLDEVVGAVGGSVIYRNTSPDLPVTVGHVSNDTRTIGEGDLYVAIKGERFDGHDFLDKALEGGASLLLVSDKDKLPERCVAVLVEDTVKALGDLARLRRFKLGARVICVTGSVGKTTTREMIVAALEPSFKVFSTKANRNNEIGLPTTILDAPEDTEILVLEMGMRLRGEISYLTKIACPDIAVITNVGYCHIERLGSREEIRLAKTEIMEGLTDNGILAVNGDDPFLFDYVRNMIPVGKGLAAVFATKTCDESVCNCPMKVTAEDKDLSGNGASFTAVSDIAGKTEDLGRVVLKQAGIHSIRNALFALLCAKLTGADIRKGEDALASYGQMKGRGLVSKGALYTVINDAYNASPESMAAAFESLSLMKCEGRKIAVLGGILELGDYAPMLHEEVGKECGKRHFDHVFLTGDNSGDLIRGMLSVDPDASYTLCADTEEIKEKLEGFAKYNDTILFKASHAFGFEALADYFLDKE